MFKRDFGPGSKAALRFTAQGFGGVKAYFANPVSAWFNDLGQCIPFLHLQGAQDPNSQAIRDYLETAPAGLFMGANDLLSPTGSNTAKGGLGTGATGGSGGTSGSPQPSTIKTTLGNQINCHGKKCFGVAPPGARSVANLSAGKSNV